MKTMMLSLSSEIDDFLTAFAYERGISKAEAMKGAFALLKIVYGLLLVCKHSVFNFQVRLLTYIRSLTALPVVGQGP
jgi:hypothetical protein